MTPEQKAFYEYGKAARTVREAIREIRQLAIHDFGEPYHRLIQSERKNLIWAVALPFEVRRARRRRAACRAWRIPSHERICKNCAHEGTHPYATPCSECFRCPFAQAYEGFGDNWEPGKEGE